MVDDVVINKVEVIERCIKRIKEVYGDDPASLNDLTKQDSIILNIQRACEAAIDLAMHVAAEERLGIPQSSREVFDLLLKRGLIESGLADRLKAMVGFRNIAVHDYQKLNLEIVQNIIEKNLKDLKEFAAILLKRSGK